jgi:hypothetical protein
VADCAFENQPESSWICVLKEPFIAEVGIDQMGMPMSLKLEMSGTARMKYKPLEPGRFQIHSTDSSDFKVKGSMTVAQQDVGFPVEKIPQAFGQKDSTWTYACAGDQLQLTAEIPELKKLSYSMTRIK